jgi:hypothetical protein
LTGQFPFEKCPICSMHGFWLKHWRRAWVVECLVCGARLVPTFSRPAMGIPSNKVLRQARIGAYSGVFAHPFRQHAPTYSGASAHL